MDGLGLFTQAAKLRVGQHTTPAIAELKKATPQTLCEGIDYSESKDGPKLLDGRGGVCVVVNPVQLRNLG